MTIGPITTDKGYSQYDRCRQLGKQCIYCGKVLSSKTTRNIHKHNAHEKELHRY